MIPDYLEQSEEHIIRVVSEHILKMRSRSKREIDNGPKFTNGCSRSYGEKNAKVRGKKAEEEKTRRRNNAILISRSSPHQSISLLAAFRAAN